MSIRIATISSAAVALVGCLVLGCTHLSLRRRPPAQPPAFQYITQQQLLVAMWQLAQQVEELDLLMRESGQVDEARRLEVIRILARMERTTTALGADGWHSNYPLIDENLGQFRHRIAEARWAVEREPPSYFLAGSVSGGCLYCHGGH